MDINIPLPQGLSLKISDAREDGKAYATRHLQKGFLLLDHGVNLAEEAVGFGVPVLKCGLQTIFPGSVALVCEQKELVWEISALFKLNLVEKISKGANQHVESNLLYMAKNFLAATIRHVRVLRNFLTTASSQLRKMFNWETTYADSDFQTQVKIKYTIESGTGKMIVEVDMGELPSDITEVVIMNEQGAHYFDTYSDGTGISIQGARIGCWDEVSAEESRFESTAHYVAFDLGQVRGARLFRGRELIDSRLAWAGFGYSFPPSIQKLRYEMKIRRLT